VADDTTTSPLSAALAAAQVELRDPERNKSGQVRGRADYRYAGLDDLLRAIRPVLARHGIAISQPIRLVDGGPVLVTQLRHGSGEVLESVWPLAWTGGPQERGSEITYGRRYTLEALVGVAATEDDDADSAQQHHDQRRPSPPPSTSASGVSGASSAARGAGPEGSSGGGQRWTTVERERFEGLLGQLVEPAVPLEVLSAYREAQGKTTPAYLSPEQRAELLRRLADPSLRVAILEWAGRDEQTAGGAA
jgi:hypothetical protein